MGKLMNDYFFKAHEELIDIIVKTLSLEKGKTIEVDKDDEIVVPAPYGNDCLVSTITLNDDGKLVMEGCDYDDTPIVVTSDYWGIPALYEIAEWIDEKYGDNE